MRILHGEYHFHGFGINRIDSSRFLQSRFLKNQTGDGDLLS